MAESGFAGKSMWGWTFLLLLGVYIWQVRKAGPGPALAIGVLLALLVPTWAVMGYQLPTRGIRFVGMPVDMRTAISFIGLVVCCVRPQKLLLLRLNFTDLAITSLVAVHVISDLKNGGAVWEPPLRAFGEWIIPYLAGRLAITELGDVRKALPFAIIVCLALGVMAAVEAISGFHLAEALYGLRPLDGVSPRMARLGLKRAFGPAQHPIYFGTLQLLLFPWAMYAASRAKHSAGPGWWYSVPITTAAGVFFTVSRGPIIGLFVALYGATAIVKTRWRVAMLVCVVIGSGVAATQYETVLKSLHMWSGEAQRVRKPKIVVNEEEVEYTGTMSRVYLFDVYGLAMRRAGLLGFGTERVTGFPIRVPVGPEQATTLKHVRFIDNVYILLTLRFGYLGLICFIAAGVSAIWNFTRLGLENEQGRAFYANMAGALAATMLVLATVWMPHDFGFVFLFSAGASAGLRYPANFPTPSESVLGLELRRAR